jgi:hypothetical protein
MVMGHSLRTLAAMTLLTIWLAPARPALGASARWTWTASERRIVQERRERVVRDSKGFYLQSDGRFNVRTNVSPDFAAELSVFMDLFHDGFCGFLFDTLKVAPPPGPQTRQVFALGEAPEKSPASDASPIPFPRKPTVVIFSGSTEYRRAFGDRSGGKFVYRWDRRGNFTHFHIYSYVPTQSGRSFASFRHSVLQHEATHCMLHALAGRKKIPLWFDEGLAELVECWDLRALLRGEVDLRYSRWSQKQALKQPGNGWYVHAPDLSRLLRITTWDVDQMGAQTRYQYAIAWNFMEFLFSTDRGQDRLREMIDRLSTGDPLLRERETYELEQHWHIYLRKCLKAAPR